jgi:hypothetical protein
MGHHISTRILEHVRDTRLENQLTAVTEHSATIKHIIDLDITEVRANIWTYCPHIKEAKQPK